MNKLISQRSIIVFLLYSAIQIFSQTGFSKENPICYGGITTHHESIYSELTEISTNPNLLNLSGSIPYNSNLIIFSVLKEGSSNYNIRAYLKESEVDLINESIPQLPFNISNPLNTNQEIFIDCKPFSIAEYCKIHNK